MDVTRRGLFWTSAAIGAAAPVGAQAAHAQGRGSIAGDLTAYDGFGSKRSGGPGDEAARAYMETRLTGLGFALRTTTVQAPYFEPQTAVLEVGGTALTVEPQAIVVQTPAEGVRAPLVLVADPGQAAAATGKIALVLLPHRRHSALASPAARGPIEAAVRAGALAVVAVTQGPSGETIALNAPPEAPLFPIPVAVVGPRVGAPALAAARAGGTATLIIRGQQGRRPAHTLIAERGPLRGEGLLVVSTPRSGWYSCAAERGPGFAIFLDLAAFTASRYPRRRLVFVSASGHEYDNQGMDAYLKDGAPRPEQVALWAHLGANIAGADFHELGPELLPLPSADAQRYLVGPAPFLPALRRAFAGLSGLEAPYSAEGGAGGELGHIIAAGYDRAFGVFGSSRLHHAETDRLPHATNAALVEAAGQGFRRAITALF